MKKNIFFFIIVGLGIFVFFYIIRGGDRATTPHPSPAPVPQKSNYKSIVPGESFMKDVVTTLGQPVRQEGSSLRNAFVYPSGLGDKPLFVYTDQGGRVYLIIEPVSESVRFANLDAQLGSPSGVLYGRLQENGYRLYVYASSGVALLANTITQSIKERWYFAPMTISEFVSAMGTGFRIEPIPAQP